MQSLAVRKENSWSNVKSKPESVSMAYDGCCGV
jgi:hypothetical protein